MSKYSHINIRYSVHKFLFAVKLSTVKAANRKLISFMSFENITFIYRTFQVWAWPLLDKRSTSEEFVLGLTDSNYKFVTWCVGHVVLVNNPILFRSYLIFDSARELKILLMNVLNSYCRSWKVLRSCMDSLKLHLAYVLRWNRRKNIYFFSRI